MTSRYEAGLIVTEWTNRVMYELNVFQILANSLPREPESDSAFWYDGGDDILCRTAELADTLADWLDDHGYCSVTGYFDPVDDEREKCVDQLTGWYYVTI